MVNRIYPSELQLNKANVSDIEASCLNLHLSVSDGFVQTKIYDKRDDFDFDIVNFPFLDGDVPRSTSYGVYTEHSGSCRRQPSTPAEGGRRAKLVCRYRVYHLSEAIKLKTRRPPTGFLVLQSHHSHTCKIWGTSAFSP